MKTILGVNHQFLYPDAMVSEKVHTETLKELVKNNEIEALDCWIWRGKAAEEEKRILCDSGKVINYNVGDRFGEDISLPTSPKEEDRIKAYDILMREISYALDVNAKKIVFASGPDMRGDREAEKDRFAELIFKVGAQLPKDIFLSLEPTDWDIDKHFLFGPLSETVEFIESIRKNGFDRIGLLLDQCHVGIMHETLESAVEKSQNVLNHVHMGNCVIKDSNDPFYGDKHVAWDYPQGEYGYKDAVKFIRLLKEAGYFDRDHCTASFEMRPIIGTSAKESLRKWIDIWETAWQGNIFV